MNLASLWKLGIVFVCENNLYGEYSPIATTTPVERLVDRAAAYAMRAEQVDGNDVSAVQAAVAAACEAARGGHGPTFLEALTYRHMGHSRSDPGAYRPEGELERWLQRDPITLLEQRLEADGVARADLDDARTAARRAVEEATARALAWPDPQPDDRFESVWAAPR
jgi:pyruvate dehydrogenase E1 component alpha subunit